MPEPSPRRSPREVTRVICASVSRVEGSVMEQLFQVRNHVSGPDPLGATRAALLYSSGWFILWLEGRAEAVEADLLRAARDARNANQVIIHRSRGAPTLEDPICVSTTQSPDGPAAFARRVYHARDEFESGQAQEPALVWQQLHSPCAYSRHQRDWSPPRRHVALVGAEDNGLIDVVRKLGERFRSPVVYQRFSGPKSHSSDVGAAYVDLPGDDGMNRVQLVARRALSHRMMRRSLAGVDALVLVPSDRTAAAMELASSVAACLGVLTARWRIYLLATSDEIAGRFCALLADAAGSSGLPAVVALPECALVEFLVGNQG